MSTTITKSSSNSLIVIVVAAFAVVVVACGSGEPEKEPDCVPDPDAKPVVVEKKIERFGLGKAGAKELVDHDWCRACVLSRANFASCQKVYSDEKGLLEDREPLKQKARDTACDDAGFKKGECPDKAIISIVCKGEKPPEGTMPPGKAVQDLFKALNPNHPALAAPDREGETPVSDGKPEKVTDPVQDKKSATPIIE